MLEFKSICVEDKKRYDYYRALDKAYTSEGAFTTLFIWNNYYNLSVAENGEFLYLRFDIKNKETAYFFPIGKGDLKKAIDELNDYSIQKGEKMKFILLSEENKQKLEEIYPNQFDFSEERNCFDYVYLTEKMISLSGKKLHSKKNHLNYFLENFSYKYISVEKPDELKKCAEKAYSLVGVKKKNLNSFELGAMKRYFDNFFELNQKGAAIIVDGSIVAMSFGEELNDETALIQIELADESYRGAYQAINKLFCENEWSEYKYVNREEDMGIEGLRKAKMSYQPIFLAVKYTCLRRD